VMHSHTAHHSGLISLVAWANRIPLRIAHARTSGASASHGMVRKLHRVTGKWLMRFFTTHRIAVSKESSEFIFGTSKNVIRLPNAIDIKHYLTPRNNRELRGRNGIPLDGIVIGQVGRLIPVKNHSFTIELLKRLLERDPKFFLVIVGDGVDRSSLENLAEQQGVRNRILFTG